MGFRRSEYRRQYKEPAQDLYQGQYRDLVSYRAYRRQLEHKHNFVEWDWDTESEEQLAGGDRRDEGTPPGHPPHSRRDGDRENLPLAASDGTRIAARGLTDREVQTPEWDHRGKKRQRTSDEGPKPKTSPAPRGQDVIRPPMLAYGWADGKRDVGCKKTFNVRASQYGDSSQVFPAALRAMRRNEYAIKYREEQKKRENLKMRRLRAAFNVPPPDESVWMSEYQRNYSGKPSTR